MRFQIDPERAADLLAEAWIAIAVRRAGGEEAQRRFLESLERACEELRAALGPPEEEDEDEPTIH